MSDFDFEDFIEFFGESENTIKTTEIRDLFDSIYQWIARKNQSRHHLWQASCWKNQSA